MYSINRFYLYSFMAFAVLLQATLLKDLKFFGALPDILLVCIIFCALYRNPSFALECAIVAALLRTVISVEHLQFALITYALPAYVIGKLKDEFYREHVLTQMVLSFICVICVYSLYYFGVALSSKYQGSYPSAFSSVIFPSAVITLVCAPFVFIILRKGVSRLY